MSITCPQCQSPVTVPAEATGAAVRCASCGHEFPAPAPSAAGSIFSSQAPWWAYVLAIVVVGGLIYLGTNRERGVAEKSKERNAAVEQAKKIATALVAFERKNGHYPASYSADARRRPLLSWRVHLLPFLGQQGLYDQFHLEESWDSPHNQELVAKIPPEYQNPGFPLPPGHTCWLAVDGPRTVLVRRELVPPAARKPGLIVSQIQDGLGSTIAFVEVDLAAAVPWTSPADYELDSEQPWRDLGDQRNGKILIAGFADGGAQAISKEGVSAELLLRLFLRDDRESVEEFFK